MHYKNQLTTLLLNNFAFKNGSISVTVSRYLAAKTPSKTSLNMFTLMKIDGLRYHVKLALIPTELLIEQAKNRDNTWYANNISHHELENCGVKTAGRSFEIQESVMKKSFHFQ